MYWLVGWLSVKDRRLLGNGDLTVVVLLHVCFGEPPPESCSYYFFTIIDINSGQTANQKSVKFIKTSFFLREREGNLLVKEEEHYCYGGIQDDRLDIQLVYHDECYIRCIQIGNYSSLLDSKGLRFLVPSAQERPL